MTLLTGAFRVAAASTGARAMLMKRAAPLAVQVRAYSDDAESFEDINSRFLRFFDNVQDDFELQRGLNNVFGYDLVPSPEVIESALRASRRLNDFALAVRIFEGIKFKVDTSEQYKQYVDALASVREELQIPLKEELFTSS
ncbi:Cytochrome c oxidase subunit 6 [Malassezia vespertilionis]|uniref:Cytochrome c oxidase subunit 6, mitochondrial n=1 Tax=Malassezia vespertilionis TaxID=2020962 RepID=A0A2N1J950_9BASI|nr:Cytochrome c oxidase subunit 6 [Malassezia vespertilionis]PKI83066.1 Cox6p [Malassezia vespertilionis]WFD07798.1 Cytochrome c oxidase subunit 6 [Malassezia vespertilionis]